MMSVATKESLLTLEKDQLIDEVLRFQTGYNDLVTKYNNDIKILQDTILIKDKEIADTKEATSDKNVSNTKIKKLEKEIVELKSVLDAGATASRNVKALQEVIDAKDKEILDLKEEINTKNLKLKDINQMVKPTVADSIIQTYFIKAFENRIGTSVYGGESYNLVTAIVKLQDSKLSWKVNIHRNELIEPGEHSSSRDLTSAELNVIKQLAADKGWYIAFKSFLSIPSEYEPETFGDTLLFT